MNNYIESRYNMKLNTQLIVGILLTLTLSMGSCDTFKDEVTPDNYSEVPKNMDGKWALTSVTRNGTNITERMDFKRFRLILNADNTYKIENYLPFIIKKDGTWKSDDPLYPFHLIFREEGTERDVTTEVKYLTKDGHRQLALELSPGCYSNKYVYTFEKVAE